MIRFGRRGFWKAASRNGQHRYGGPGGGAGLGHLQGQGLQSIDRLLSDRRVSEPVDHMAGRCWSRILHCQVLWEEHLRIGRGQLLRRPPDRLQRTDRLGDGQQVDERKGPGVPQPALGDVSPRAD